MQVLIVEDDHLQAEELARRLDAEFKDIQHTVISSESGFRESFRSLTESPPDFIILDAMMRWGMPEPQPDTRQQTSEPMDDRDPLRAGIRCLELLRSDNRTNSIPVIMQSVLRRGDIFGSSIIPSNVVYCQKEDSFHNLIKLIHSLALASGKSVIKKNEKRVFLAHGREHGIRDSTARFLEKIGLEPIILDEQPNNGMHILSKLFLHSNVHSSIVLLTGDDQGSLWGEPRARLNRRARQNVIFELGFFLGKLGPNRVVALFEKGVELPSDYQGIIYILLDPHGAWRTLLARELKVMGLEVDLNRIG